MTLWTASEAAAAKRRVKMIIEHPEQAKEYILMGLRHNPSMSSVEIIRMIDFFRTLAPPRGHSSCVCDCGVASQVCCSVFVDLVLRVK